MKLTSKKDLDHLKSVLFSTIDILEENNIRYWLDFGTLLGAYRDGMIIPHDDDIDIGIFHEDIEKVREIRTDPPNEGSSHLIPFFKKVDIFSYIENENGDLYCPSYSSSPFPKGYVETLSSIEMYDRIFSIPSSISDYLIIKYGNNFDVSNKDRIDEHVTIIKGGKRQDIFDIYDIEWLESKITYSYKSSEPKDVIIRIRENDLNGKVIYYDTKKLSSPVNQWVIPNTKFNHFHTLYLTINEGNDLLFYQKLVYSTDIRTQNMYRILL